MEEKMSAISNSPIVQTHTPIKRLGLSRKRKSLNSPCGLEKRDDASDPSSSSPVCKREKIARVEETELSSREKDEKASNRPGEETSGNDIDYDTELACIRKRIEDKTSALKALESNKAKVVELQSLIDVWKEGCKNAYLHLLELIRDRQIEGCKTKNLLNTLGIKAVMVENFRDDYDVSLSDCSQ